VQVFQEPDGVSGEDGIIFKGAEGVLGRTASRRMNITVNISGVHKAEGASIYDGIPAERAKLDAEFLRSRLDNLKAIEQGRPPALERSPRRRLAGARVTFCATLAVVVALLLALALPWEQKDRFLEVNPRKPITGAVFHTKVADSGALAPAGESFDLEFADSMLEPLESNYQGIREQVYPILDKLAAMLQAGQSPRSIDLIGLSVYMLPEDFYTGFEHSAVPEYREAEASGDESAAGYAGVRLQMVEVGGRIRSRVREFYDGFAAAFESGVYDSTALEGSIRDYRQELDALFCRYDELARLLPPFAGR
jgi:hypothetical protein